METLEKLSSLQFYKILVSKIFKPATSIITFNTKYNTVLDWEKIFMIPRFACTDTYTRIFQYKILHNILFLNDRLYHLKLSDTQLCSLCKGEKETCQHLFLDCKISKNNWRHLQSKICNVISLKDLNPQSAFCGFLDEEKNTFNIKNQLLLIFKCFIY